MIGKIEHGLVEQAMQTPGEISMTQMLEMAQY